MVGDVCRYFILRSNEPEYGNNEILEKEWFSLSSEIPAAQDYSTAESAKALKLFCNDLERQMLREFMVHESEKKN